MAASIAIDLPAGRHRRSGRHRRREPASGATTVAATANLVSSALLVAVPAYSVWWLAHN